MLRQLPGQSEFVFRMLMEYEISRSQRYPNPLALLRIGLALVKPTLTEVENAPIALANIISSHVRTIDISGKIGNEFAILLPNTNEAGARIVCERLMQITHGTHSARPGSSSRVSICIGLASHEGGPKLNSEQLMNDAESALQQALAVGPRTYRALSDKSPRR
jgi:hypothetical protein